MRVLVSGGAGFIGSHLVDALISRGDDVVVLDDFSTGYRENVDAASVLVEGSVVDESAVRTAMRGLVPCGRPQGAPRRRVAALPAPGTNACGG